MSGCEKCKSITLFSGNDGADGINGTDGQYGGWSSDWLFDTGTGTGTGGKYFRFDNATLASVATLYINDLNSVATDLSAFIAAWDNSGDYGLVRVSNEDDANIFWMGIVTAVTDLGSEHSIKATHVASNGTFTSNDVSVISFVRNGSAGTNGTNGTNGTAGTDGAYGGWSSEWEWDSSTASGSGTGEIRFDNGTLASVTGMYINDVNSDAANLEAFLDAFNNSGNFGLIRVSKKSNPAVFWMGEVTAETDSGTEHDVTVTYTAHSGSFTDGDAVIVSFVNNGADAVATYDSYVAQLTQTVGAPVATYTLENTIGAVGFTYTSAGKYKITSAGLFTAGKTFASISADAQGSTVNTIMIHWVSTSEIWVHTYSITGAAYTDAILNNTSVEIRVYA